MMYEEYFGFSKRPFCVTPDPDFFSTGTSHRQGLAHLRYGIREGMGFVVLSGEVGTGKTHLVRMLLKELGDETQRALIVNPALDPEDLFDAILSDLEVNVDLSLSTREKLEKFVEYLIRQNQDGRRVVILIDEAQNLSIPSLERLRLLSNLETVSKKLLQIFLIGQPELDLLLNLPVLRQVRQRIVVRCHLDPLTLEETEAYVRHRLFVVGGSETEDIFTKPSLRAIHTAAGGIPRLINILCDYCLVIAYTEETETVTPRMVQEAVDLHRSREVVSVPRQIKVRYRRRMAIPVAAAAAMAVFAVGLTAWNLTVSMVAPDAERQAAVVLLDEPAPAVSEPLVVEAPRPLRESQREDSIPSPPPTRKEAIPPQEDPISAPALFLPETALASPDAESQGTDQPPGEPSVAAAAVPPEEPPLLLTESEEADIARAKLAHAINELAGPILDLGPNTHAAPAVSPQPLPEYDAGRESAEEEYGVQVASFRTMEKAVEMADLVADFGPVFLVESHSGTGSDWIRVIVGRFGEKVDAEDCAERLKRQGVVREALVVRNSAWGDRTQVASTR